MALLVTPLHLFGAYCILKKTPSTMHSVKLTLLNFHFWNVLVDLMLNVFAIPFPLFPSASGFLLGLFSYWGIRQTVQLWILITSLCFICVSTTMIFENRFRLLNHKNKHWKKFQPFWVVGNILFVFIFLIPTMLQVPDQDQARQMVFSVLPCIPDFLYSTEIIVPSLNNDIIVFTAFLFILVVFGQLLTFTIVIIVQLSSNFGANLLSESTRRLQKNLLKALIWQTGIPLIYLVLPASLSMLTIPLGIYSRPLNNINIAVMSLHGLVSTLSMILIHKPYRSTVAKCWKKKGTRENSRLVNNFPLFTTNAPVGYYVTH
ncbi:Protein CBG26920 [Caenorhabditis briggsae]|uniref:Protein CBG26920 n=1 Tax=Caenorhabditis briggsae TaxID=6238 RepID=B6IER3_CAEBR|nr:Protein CBG26920 [Caenorhabditis briggsae]CAR98393.1 Protein CBG26920 [Caenorhabditis briggsae]